MTRVEELENLSLDSLPQDVPRLQSGYSEIVSELISVYKQLDHVKHLAFGRKSERFVDDRQLEFFAPEQLEEKCEDEEEEDEVEVVVKKKRGKQKKNRLENLPEIEIHRHPEASELECSCCGTQKKETHTTDTKQIDYEPAKVSVKKTINHHYECACGCSNGLTSPKPEPHIIDRCLATPELLSFVLTSKFCDHMPLNRIRSMLLREGVDIAETTMIGWMQKVGGAVEGVSDWILQKIRSSEIVGSDDTRIVVLGDKDGGSGGSFEGRIWQYQSIENYILYDFQQDRSRAGPREILAEYDGYLQVDGCTAYNERFAQGAKEVACWAHARRKFFELPKRQKLRNPALKWIKQLYDIERHIKKEEFDIEEKRIYRQAFSIPVLNGFKKWLDEQNPLPKSDFAKAKNYVVNNWEAFCRYCEDGRLEIDNNWIERGMRPVAVGRKNWLFVGGLSAGKNAARIMTLAGNCKLAGVNPTSYFVYLMKNYTRYIDTDPEMLTPQAYARSLSAA